MTKKIPRSVARGEPSAAGGKEGGGTALATRIKTGVERAAAVTGREAERPFTYCELHCDAGRLRLTVIHLHRVQLDYVTLID